MNKKKYKVRWNRILFVALIPLVLIFLIYFGLIKDYEKERLIKIGYNEVEIKGIREELTSEEIKKLSDYDYLSYLTELINVEDYKSENLLSYINYINEIKTEYDIQNAVYLVNNGINYDYSIKLVDIAKHDYFIKNRLDRYMAYESDDINTIITSVNSNIDYEFYTNTIPTKINEGILLIANKYNYLEESYVPANLVKMDKEYDNKNGNMLDSTAYEAFKKLVEQAELEGYHIRNNSAYRSFNTQSTLYNSYKNDYGITYADKWSARPGYSEHQTGLALDVGVQTKYANGKFENSKEFIWMKENSYKFGFILRYPKGKEHITGYSYEPWHYRYVGIEAATYIYENDITFEEYHAYFMENN